MVRTPRLVLTTSLLLGSTLALGCSDRATHRLSVDASMAVHEGVTTADGWIVTFDQLVVVVHNPGLVERTDNEPAWVREAGVTVWDAIADVDEDETLSRIIRAVRYDGADFRIAPASESGYEAVAGNVADSVVTAAVDGGWSIRVVGSASDSSGGQTVGFDWTFDTNTFYRCQFTGDAVVELVEDDDETTVIEILGETLLRGSGTTGEFEFAAIAAADADGDGQVSKAELQSAGLWDQLEQRSGELGGIRGAGACPII
jgi:hypothetical protein